MTFERVMQLAAQFGPGERRIRWMECGTHDLKKLPRTDTGGEGGPFIYCPECFCAWTKDGALLNAPKQHERS
jgi:hypothetical protein